MRLRCGGSLHSHLVGCSQDAHEAEEAAKARAEKQAKVETVEFLHRQAAAKEEARKREREQQLAWDRQKMVRGHGGVPQRQAALRSTRG